MPNTKKREDQDNLAAANAQAEKATIDRKAKEAAKNGSTLTEIFNLLKKANLDSPNSKETIRNIAKQYEDNKMTLLLATMMMFLKKDVLGKQTFNWLSVSMACIGAIYTITSALFSNGFLNSFNLGKIMELPFQGLNSLFGLMTDKNETSDKVKNMTDKVVNCINSAKDAGGIVQSALNAVADEKVVEAISNSEPVKKGRAFVEENMAQVKDGVQDIVTTGIKSTVMDEEVQTQLIDKLSKQMQEQVTIENVTEFCQKNAGKICTPEVKQQATEMATEVCKELGKQATGYVVEQASGVANSVGANIYNGASNLYQEASSGISSLLGYFGIHASTAQTTSEADMKVEQTTTQQNVL